MRFRHFVQTCAATAALALATPALADQTPGADYAGSPSAAPLPPPAPAATLPPIPAAGPGTAPAGPDVRPDWYGGAGYPQHPGMEPTRREAWLAECRDRMSYHDRKRKRRGPVADQCMSYLDDYYAYYAAAASRGYGYGQPVYAGYGCCQPATYAAPRSEPECTETVEYVTEEVPVRPASRRIPAKRVKIVPDKRVKIN